MLTVIDVKEGARRENLEQFVKNLFFNPSDGPSLQIFYLSCRWSNCTADTLAAYGLTALQKADTLAAGGLTAL